MINFCDLLFCHDFIRINITDIGYIMNIRSEIKSLKDTLISTRRDFHKHPELSFKEFRTSKIIADKLESYGLEVIRKVGKTGVVGTLKGSSKGPSIAFRADMDALPIQETGNLEYKSINDGVMHACGHDGHMAILLAAAEVLSKYRESISGTIKFIFQPAEEGLGGARYMIEDGALENVDQIFGLHLWNYQKIGTIGVKSGPMMAAADLFEIKIRGVGGHGASPQGTADAIIASSYLIQSLQTIVSRNINPIESGVVTVGKINGGYNFNVISDYVTLQGTTRAYTEEIRKLIENRMSEIINGIQTAFNVSIEFKYNKGYPPVINCENETNILVHAANKIVGTTNVGNPYLTMGGEDFSYYLEKIPGCFFFVGSSPNTKEFLKTPHHCPHFDIDEKSLLIGSSIFLQIAEDLLK